MKRRLLAGLLVLVAVDARAAETPRAPKARGEIVVAVIDFDNPSGRDLPGIGRVAHDVIGAHIVGLPGVALVTRVKLGSVLKEQGLAASGLVGNRANSTRVAQLLGADFMVTGAVLNYAIEQRPFAGFGIRTVTAFHRMKVSMQVVDLGSARISLAKTYDLEFRDPAQNPGGAGRERDLLDALVQQAADDLRRALSARSEAAAEAAAPAEALKIPIVSVPPGADIELNGLYVGTTPAEVKMEPGVQTLRILLQGYRPWERRIQATADLKVAPVLAPLPPEEKITIEQKRSN